MQAINVPAISVHAYCGFEITPDAVLSYVRYAKEYTLAIASSGHIDNAHRFVRLHRSAVHQLECSLLYTSHENQLQTASLSHAIRHGVIWFLYRSESTSGELRDYVIDISQHE